jgi:uncharacterized protein
MPPRGTSRAIGKRPRMSRFLRLLVLLTAVAHIPFLLAVVVFAERIAFPAPWSLAFALTAFGIGVFVARAGAGMADRRRAPLMINLVDIPFFIHWCACLFTVVPSAVVTLIAPIVDAVRGRPVTLPWEFYLWAYGAGLAVAAYGILIRRKWFVVKEVDVPIADLDSKLDGFRIAHLSDLHIGAITPRSWGERWVRAANRAAPDIAVITGDMVTSGTDFHEDIADVVAMLEAKSGVFVSMGNHDYFGEGEPLISLIRARGPKVLRNEGLTIEKNDAKLFIAAIDDTWTRRDDLHRALADRPEGVPVVLLAHDPERFIQAAKLGVDLTLSGHTHGGQIAVPFLAKWLSFSHLTHHFHLGLYKKDRSTLYVHPGLGTTGPPIRIGVAPAVVILTLRRAS